MKSLNILHIDDDAQLCQTVAELLTAHDMHVTSASSGEQGLRLAAKEAFDVVVLDRMLPDMGGIDIVRKLRETGIETPVLMLSALGLSGNRVEGLEAGADDYLAKPFEQSELVARIHALDRRARNRAHSAVILYGPLECHVKARTAYRDGRHVPLSPREFELFRYFMENAGEVVTRDMLLHDVWKIDFDPQTNVIDVNVGRLRRKLEDGFATPVLETVWGSGYRLMSG